MANYISVDVTSATPTLAGIRLVPIDNITTIIATSLTQTVINYKYLDTGGSELASFTFTHATVGVNVTAFVDLIITAIATSIARPSTLVPIDVSTYAVSAITVALG